MPVTLIKSTDAGAPELTGLAGGLITVLDYALVTRLGWTKAQTGTNKAAYKASAPEASGALFWVDDTTTKYATVRGYETMSGLDTGTNPFPTTMQTTLYAQKSNTADSAARPWMIVGDERLFYLVTEWHSVYPSNGDIVVFGDIVSFKSGDAWPALIIAGVYNTPSYPSQHTNNAFSKLEGACVGHYLARNYAQVVGSIAALKYGHRTTTGMGNSTALAYPAPVDNGLYLTPVEVWESVTIRGLLPGCYAPLNHNPGNHGDTITDIVGLPGKSVKLINISYTTTPYRVGIDVTGPWR